MTSVRVSGAPSALLAGCLGAVVAVWAAGLRMLDPREIGWVMHGDWQVHFLGWHFFRHEAWHMPPGRIDGLLEPVGTSLGYTDAIPLAALVLKPFVAWLPNPFQYLGMWLMVCFALQAFFGALVIGTWTPRRSLQVVGAMLFVFLPTLAARIGHPALCAHWLLLWALWLYWRTPVTARRDAIDHAALGLTSGLVHPYLAVMSLALLAALFLRRLIEPQQARVRAIPAFLLACCSVGVGWWASGLFTLPAASDMTASSGTYSMNLLAVLNPGAIPSRFLPGFPAVSAAQLGEGYQYLGFGVLVLCAAAVALFVTARPMVGQSVPLLVVLGALVAYSVLPVVSIGRHVLVDVSDASMFTMFRSTGRFFWPAAYAIVSSAIGTVSTVLRWRLAAVLLASALVLQVIDQQQWWSEMHRGSRSDGFFAWDMPLRSATWHEVLPRYQHMRLYFPERCRNRTAIAGAGPAYLAGLYGLTLNDGVAARVDSAKQAEACEDLQSDFLRGVVNDETVYVMAPSTASEFEARLGAEVECRPADDVVLCATRRSSATRPDAP